MRRATSDKSEMKGPGVQSSKYSSRTAIQYYIEHSIDKRMIVPYHADLSGDGSNCFLVKRHVECMMCFFYWIVELCRVE